MIKMIKTLTDWLNEYPKSAIEINASYIKEIQVSKKMEIIEKTTVQINQYTSDIKENILLNLDSTHLSYYFLDIKEKIHSTKYLQNYIIWDMESKNIDPSLIDYKNIPLKENRHLIIFYTKGTVEKIIEELNLENVIVTPSFWGYYNYWKYINNKEDKNTILISMNENLTEILFIKKGELHYAKNIDMGSLDILGKEGVKNTLGNNNLELRWVGELENVIKYYNTHDNREESEYTIEFMGYELLSNTLIDLIKKRSNFNCLNQEDFVLDNLDYISLLGNLYSLYKK